MKKQLLFLAVFLLCTPLLKAKDFSYQKQILVTESASSPLASTCQAVYIAPNWLLTAAHCITPAVSSAAHDLALNPQQDCNVRIVLAQEGEVVLSAAISCEEVHFPQEIVNKEGRKVLPFDLALLHYKDGSVPYEYYNATTGLPEEEDKSLRKKWKRSKPSQFLPLYTVKAKKEEQSPRVYPFTVANVEEGTASYVSFSAVPFFVGNTLEDPSGAQATWGVRDFGVTHGESGGGVMLRLKDGSLGLLGIVSAATYRLATDGTDESEKFLFFTAFDEEVSLSFIEPFVSKDRIKPLLKAKPTKEPQIYSI